jgi:putative hemolysin
VEVIFISLLIILNALFAMSEMALASSRKIRLIAMQEAGVNGATSALRLMEHPTEFLSVVQIGITSIGVLNGIVGEAAFSESLAWGLDRLGVNHNWSHGLATAIVVSCITLLTILLGELVPKRLGQLYPEAIARWVAPTMIRLARFSRPLVLALSKATAAILRLIGANNHNSQTVTEEEIQASLSEGVDAGVIEMQEHQMVRNVFHLDDRPLSSLMVPRSDIAWLANDTLVQDALTRFSDPSIHSWYPVCKDGLDHVIGMVSLAELVRSTDKTATVESIMVPAMFVPETLSGLDLLEQIRKPQLSRHHRSFARVVMVVDEYGVVQGLVTPHDLLEAITGEWMRPDQPENAWAVQQADGSWQIDGAMPVAEFKIRLGIEDPLPDDDKDLYNTVAGLILLLLGHLPVAGEKVHCNGWTLEVTGLQQRRIESVRALKTAY